MELGVRCRRAKMCGGSRYAGGRCTGVKTRLGQQISSIAMSTWAIQRLLQCREGNLLFGVQIVHDDIFVARIAKSLNGTTWDTRDSRCVGSGMHQQEDYYCEVWSIDEDTHALLAPVVNGVSRPRMPASSMTESVK